MRYVRSLSVGVWCGLCFVFTAASCGGNAFTRAQANGGAAESGSGHAGSGVAASDDAGGAAGALGGASAYGGGGAGNGEAGAANGEAGTENTADDCSVLGGSRFGGHCYVDATVNSVSAQQAVATCKALAPDAKVASHLLVLDSPEEQSFILRQFLVPFTDKSDAWLGLTCSELEQPDIEACYCMGCTKAVLAEKQRAWSWLSGASSTFGWINANPNGGFRCAALGYNPETTNWGWVDRPCEKSLVTPISGHVHEYRVLCEREPRN